MPHTYITISSLKIKEFEVRIDECKTCKTKRTAKISDERKIITHYEKNGEPYSHLEEPECKL